MRPSISSGTPRTPTPSLAPVPTPSDRDWQRGPQSAPVTLVAYMDFQCGPCNAAARAMDQTFRRHPGQVRQVYRPFPLSNVEDKADLAAQVAEAAGRQGAFWPMHDLLVDQYDDWRALEPDAFLSWSLQAAKSLGLDPDAFQQAVEDPALANQIAERYSESRASGIPGTPFVFLNGRPYILAGDEIQLESAVRLGILQAQQYATYPQMNLQPGVNYLARLQTNRGEIQIQLYAGTAPLAVNSFVYLAQQGWYTNTGAYQVTPGQGVGLGDPSWTGLGEAGYHYPPEIDATRNFDRAGIVGVIPTGPGINGSRFFVTLSPLPAYDETHTVLGRVTQGLDTLSSLSERSPKDDLLTKPELIIQSIEIETK
ncbi:MAG: peptidylprolyl isomerase [Anaerolineales bacterium]